MARIRGRADWAVLRWLLPFAFLHGLIYLVLVPPWQHYDEPAHFEYARLIAETGTVPAFDAVSTEARWQIAESMGRFHFWGSSPPINGRTGDLPVLGYNQRVHPPLYYQLAALPIRLTLTQSVEVQLFAARLLSVIFYTLTVAAVWRLSVVAAPDAPLVQLAVPLIYALVPPFAAIMTAVNNDVLVNFTGAALLLGCGLLIRDGPRFASLSLAILSIVVGMLAKRTALPFLLPLTLSIFWGSARQPVRPSRWLLIVGSATLVAAGAGLQLDTSGATPTLGLRSWVNTLDANYLRLGIDPMVHSLTDWRLSAPIYPGAFWVAFTTFWVAYGWGHVQIGMGWDWAMLGLNLAASVGLGVRIWRLRVATALWQKRIIWLFLAVAVSGFSALILRIHPLPAYGGYDYLPRGRYVFSGLPATIWLITLGVMGLGPNDRTQDAVSGLLGLMFVLEGFGLARLVQYYYGSPWPIAVFAAQKPGLLGLPPLYPVLFALYLGAVGVILRRIARLR